MVLCADFDFYEEYLFQDLEKQTKKGKDYEQHEKILYQSACGIPLGP